MPQPYRVEIVKNAEKEYSSLPSVIKEKIKAKVLSLEREPRPSGCKRLKQSEYYRIRSGDYRVIYSVNDKSRIVRVLTIAHRREAYR